MTREEFAEKWGYQSGYGYGSAQFDCKDSLLKDLRMLISGEVELLCRNAWRCAASDTVKALQPELEDEWIKDNL
jgi:hypothetical protein